MSRGKPLVGLVLFCGAWIGLGRGVSRGAVIEAPLVSGLSELADGFEAGLADRAVAANLSKAMFPMVVQPCDDREFVRLSSGCNQPTEPAGSASPPSSELPFGPAADPIIAPFEIPAGERVFDFAAGQPSFSSLPPLPAGIAPALLDELVARPEDTAPFWAQKGDIVASYGVPALAVLALVVSGLLLRQLVRRRQRAALARRLKQSVGRSRRRRPASRSSPRSG